MTPKKHLLALAAALALAGYATAAQEAVKAVSVREAAAPVTNATGEIRYTVTLDAYYVSTLADAAREAGYVHGSATAIEAKPEMRFAADRLAALIGKKPESVQPQASAEFDIFASPQEILQLAPAEGVVGIAQREGRMDLITTLPPGSPSLVTIHEAMKPVKNAAGEILYTISLNPFYTFTLMEAAREAGYVQADSGVVGFGSPEVQRPEVRFAADRIAAVIDRRPEKVRSRAATEFDVYASREAILRLAGVEGVNGIRQMEGAAVAGPAVVMPPDWMPEKEGQKAVSIREARRPVSNAAGEIRYTVRLNPFYTFSLVNEARAAGYVQADPNVAGFNSPEVEKPEVRFAADRIAALVGKKPEKIRSWAATEFDIYASREEILRLAAVAEGVNEIEQQEDISGLVGPGIPPSELPRVNLPEERRWLRIISTQERVINENREVGYIVRLNPFYVDAFKPDALAAGYVQANIMEVGGSAPEVQKPEVRFVADKIAGRIKRKPAKIRSRAATEFDIYATPEEVQSLIGVEGINEIAEMEGKVYAAPAQSMPVAPGDVWSGNEIIPWWKTNVNTNDFQDFSHLQNAVVIIDGHMAPPISPDLNIVYVGGYASTASDDWGRWHAAHVAGVFGAKRNNYLIRGVNPGYPIASIGISWLDNNTMLNAFDEAYTYYDDRNTWGAIDFSTAIDGSSGVNIFEFSQPIGRMMAVSSNRAIVLQAAGNGSSNACGWGYQYTNHTLDYDGILLIGGHNIENQRSGHSNAGACVELWAPSEQITSIRYNSDTTYLLSGTSVAAPIATGIAMRHGNQNTRPLEREHFLRANAQYQENITGYPARFVKYGNSPDKLLRHAISGVWSPQTTFNISALYNGNYGDMWNAGGNYGSIVIDLGSVKNVSHIRVTPRSSVALSEVYPLHFAVAPASTAYGNPSGAWQYFNYPKHGDMAPLTIPVYGMNTRYIELDAYNYGSWLAYSEVEVYGK